ncbi:MAG: pyridoxal phosphate-dependent aminotransferase [Elusimicrobia bacterium]|nr:pyridoxal phosphate-dependent aminotransferase [Elusimicrobiota bacterium]
MLSRLAQNIAGSSTLEIAAKAKQLKAEGKDVISLSAGEPDFDTPQFIKDACIQALLDGKTKYTPTSGEIELKKAIIQKFEKDNNLSYEANEIIVSCGAKHSIFNIILCAVEEGDEVIIPAPYWVSYPEMVKAAGAKPVIADTFSTNMKLTPEILLPLINKSTKILILNSPSNPTGGVYSLEELKALAKIILKHNITVISDEIYEHLTYDSDFVSIASISDELKKKTVVVNGVSKAYSMTGWRIGYAAGNSDLISAASRLQSHSTSNPTSFAQYGAIAALSSPLGKNAIKEMAEKFKTRRDYIYKRICSIPGVQCRKPSGAFYIFPDIREVLRGKTSMEFAKDILEKEYLAIVPGEGFGAPGYIRFSYAASLSDIETGMDRLERYIRSS